MEETSKDKLQKLRQSLRKMEKVLVAFSGGVDSTFLLKVAHEELGHNVLAVTATSSTYPAQEQRDAQKIVEELGVRHKFIVSEELEIEGFADNPPNRCYYCKKERYTKLWELAKAEGINYLLDGSNFDDLADHRPGMLAAKELEVRSPLMEVGLTKEEIRFLSKELNLPTWKKPSFACLSSRFPYGTRITKEKLAQVDRGEEVLRALGFQQFRLRHHGEIARIELTRDQFSLMMEKVDLVVDELKKCGFTYVTMDLQGYRTGSMNETLNIRG